MLATWVSHRYNIYKNFVKLATSSSENDKN